MAKLRITAPEAPIEISPLIYGDFLEFIGRMTAVMWGERLDDRKFAGHLPPRAEFFFLTEEEAQFQRPWRETVWQAEGRAVLDEADPFCGDRCMRIEAREIASNGRTVSSPSNGWVGIRQKVWVRKGEALRFSGHFRSSEPVRIKVAVGRFMGCFVQPYGEAAEFEVTGDRWHRIEAGLVSQVADDEADFVLLLQSEGKLWADSLSLMAEEDLQKYRGWRGDVVEAVRALKPGVMRFGGSELNHYGWRWGVGDRDSRAPFQKFYWGGMEWNDVGIDEFLDFCALTESEPLLCVNANTEGPDDALALMEHCARRPSGPHVRLWQIGNELSGPEYEKALPEFCKAMKEAHPDATLLTAYPPTDETLKKIGHLIEYVAPHYYTPDVEKAAAETAELRARLGGMTETAEHGARLRGMPETQHIKLAITEWNQTASWWGPGRARQSTLGNGLYVGWMLNHYRRNADLIGIANRSNIADSWLSGSIQVRASRIWFHPAYHVQRLFANHGGSRLLEVEGDCCDLDITAALDDDGNACLTIVNTKNEAVPLDVDLTDIGTFSSANAHIVSGDDEWTTNHIAEPDKIGVEQRDVPLPGGALVWAALPYSASVLVTQ